MFRDRYPEKKPNGLNEVTEAVRHFFKFHAHRRNSDPVFETPELSMLHVGLSVLSRYQSRSTAFGRKSIIEDLVGIDEKRQDKQFLLDALIANTAVEFSYLADNSLLRSARYGTDSRLLHLTKLGKKEPYREVAISAILYARDNLIDQYAHDTRLEDPDNHFLCAQIIGQAILQAQPMVEPSEIPEDN